MTTSGIRTQDTEAAAAAWRAAAIGEAAGVYAYASATGPIADSRRDQVSRWYLAHLRARDAALAEVARLGGELPALPGSFTLPKSFNTTADAEQLLAGVEARLVPVYADVAAATAPDNDLAIRRINAAIGRAIAWGASVGPWGPQVDS